MPALSVFVPLSSLLRNAIFFWQNNDALDEVYDSRHVEGSPSVHGGAGGLHAAPSRPVSASAPPPSSAGQQGGAYIALSSSATSPRFVRSAMPQHEGAVELQAVRLNSYLSHPSYPSSSVPLASFTPQVYPPSAPQMFSSTPPGQRGRPCSNTLSLPPHVGAASSSASFTEGGEAKAVPSLQLSSSFLSLQSAGPSGGEGGGLLPPHTTRSMVSSLASPLVRGVQQGDTAVAGGARYGAYSSFDGRVLSSTRPSSALVSPTNKGAFVPPSSNGALYKLMPVRPYTNACFYRPRSARASPTRTNACVFVSSLFM